MIVCLFGVLRNGKFLICFRLSCSICRIMLVRLEWWILGLVNLVCDRNFVFEYRW